MESSTDAFFREVLADRTPVADQLEKIHGLAWEVADPVLLDLCRLRIAMLLGCHSELEVLNSDLDSDKLLLFLNGLRRVCSVSVKSHVCDSLKNSLLMSRRFPIVQPLQFVITLGRRVSLIL